MMKLCYHDLGNQRQGKIREISDQQKRENIIETG